MPPVGCICEYDVAFGKAHATLCKSLLIVVEHICVGLNAPSPPPTVHAWVVTCWLLGLL